MSTATIEIKPRVMVAGTTAMGPGKAELLERIAECGSISTAAKAMGMSYSHAWQLVDAMNQTFKQPVVQASTGGKAGGGATLTEVGIQALALYREIQHSLATLAAAQAKAQAYQKRLNKLLK